jgi:hypothetical protein
MDREKAYDILDIDRNTVYFSYKELKKKYHKQALKYHPDKNGNNLESTERFQQINEAFEYLKEISFDSDSEEEGEKDHENNNFSVYKNILTTFLSSLVEGKYREILQSLLLNMKSSLTLEVLNDLDKDTCMNIYIFLNRYSSVFHLSQEFLSRVREKVLKKFEDTTLYILNPSIDDLLCNNFYKLTVDDTAFYVPLWHHESYFDNFIVLCEPHLPVGYYLDENNNLNIKLSFTMKELLHENTIDVQIGSRLKKTIAVEDLHIKRNQNYRLRGCGISKINEYDIYDVSEKSDIILNIEIDFELNAKYL